MAQGVTFDHYEVLTRDDGSIWELGRGAMGITYRAFDKNLECDVALKVISGNYLNTDGARDRFVREARAAAKLRHPNVASVFHLGLEGDSYFYAMEFIDGETVEERVQSQGPLEPILALRIVGQVARALHAAQKHSLVHRDIKPSNLMLVHEDDEISVKVIDFGLAKVSDPEASMAGAATTIGGFVGTPYYASPEQLQEKTLDSRSDIYSLGMTFWFMLMGSAPYTGTLAEVMSQHLFAEPPVEQLSVFPAPLAHLVARMVEKDPAKRPQSPAELRREVERVIGILESEVAAAWTGGSEDADLMETVADDLGGAEVAEVVDPEAAMAVRYELLEDLGEGEMGDLYKARNRETGEIVRLVKLNPSFVSDAEKYTQLEHEVEKVQAFTHPNILRIVTLEWIDPVATLAFEWTEGFSLLETLRSRRVLAPDEVLLLLEQLAEAVDSAVGAGLDRLDFALHKVLLAFADPIGPEREVELIHMAIRDWPTFTLKVNPLGIARELTMSDTWAGGRTIVGEISVVSAADSAVSEEDIRPRYVQALAALVYELLGGTLPPDILRPGTARSLSRYVPISTLPEEGNSVLRRGLDPEVSYPSGRAFFEALRRVETSITRRPVTPGVPVPKPPVAAAGSTVPPTAPVERKAPKLPVERKAPELPVEPRAPKLPVERKAPETPVEPGVPKLPVEPKPPELPVETAPPVLAPKRPKSPKTKVPLIVAGTIVGLLLVGGLVVVVIPLIPKTRPIVDNGSTPTPTPAVTPVVTPTAAPTATLSPPPTPVPTPPNQDLLKAAVTKAESFENERKWGEAIAAYVAIAKDFPETDLGQVRLEILLQRLRNHPEDLGGEDFEQLREPLTGAAKLGVTSAMFLLGENLREEDPKASFDWLCAAAAQGSQQAFTQIGLMYSNGAGVERDFKRAVWWFEEAGKRGDSTGLTLLAECYLDGKGVAKDPAKAASILEEAVAMGEPRAMNLLGTLYQKGVGVKEDFQQARKLFTQSYEQGYLNALGNLGVLYINGQGVERDVKKAVSLFEKGARQGSDNCMYFYGRCLENGLGVPRDLNEAKKWIKKAAAAGHARAKEWCEENGVSY